MSDHQELDEMINDEWPSWTDVNKETIRAVGRILLRSGLQADEAFDLLERLYGAVSGELVRRIIEVYGK
jgi:hypothetical protein